MGTGNASTLSDWAPFRIEPAFVDKVWGYRDLRPWFDRVAAAEPIGEVWLTGNQCTAGTGPHAGATLETLFAESAEALLGSGSIAAESPLLIKVIFALEKLSVQVHPDDRLAQKYGEPRGKTECWYVLAADSDAALAVGLRPGATLEEVRHAIESGTLEADLRLLPVSTGDMILVDAGTVHAVWPGSILLEVQQYSDTTYRLYDYGRPRPLHIDKGLEAIRTETRSGKVGAVALADRTVLIDTQYFRIERIAVSGRMRSERLAGDPNLNHPEAGLSYLFAAGGKGRITLDNSESLELNPRAIVCVPTAAPPFFVESPGGLDLIRITPRPPANR